MVIPSAPAAAGLCKDLMCAHHSQFLWPQVAKLQQVFKKGLQNQNRAVVNLFKAPNKIEDVAATLQVGG